MVGFLDIAPFGKTVHGVAVTGLSLVGIQTIVTKFPEIIPVLEGKVDGKALAEIAPRAIGDILAAGIGFPGDAEQIARANLLPGEIQLDFLDAIIEATAPDGLGPFAVRVWSILNAGPRPAPPPPSMPTAPEKTPAEEVSTTSPPSPPKSYKRVATRPL